MMFIRCLGLWLRAVLFPKRTITMSHDHATLLVVVRGIRRLEARIALCGDHPELEDALQKGRDLVCKSVRSIVSGPPLIVVDFTEAFLMLQALLIEATKPNCHSHVIHDVAVFGYALECASRDLHVKNRDAILRWRDHVVHLVCDSVRSANQEEGV